MEKLFLIVGLVLNLLGTTILISPFFKYKIWETDDEDGIPEGGWGKSRNGEHWFTRNGLLKNRRVAIWGLGFIFFGFLLQLLSMIDLKTVKSWF